MLLNLSARLRDVKFPQIPPLQNHGGFGGGAFGMNGKKGASQSWDLPDLDEESESVDGKSDSGSKRGSRSSSSTANNVAPNNQKDDGGGDT